jgi:hypothetical protein
MEPIPLISSGTDQRLALRLAGKLYVTNYSLSSSPIPGPSRSGKVVHVTAATRIFFFPSASGVEYKSVAAFAAKGPPL